MREYSLFSIFLAKLSRLSWIRRTVGDLITPSLCLHGSRMEANNLSLSPFVFPGTDGAILAASAGAQHGKSGEDNEIQAYKTPSQFPGSAMSFSFRGPERSITLAYNPVVTFVPMVRYDGVANRAVRAAFIGAGFNTTKTKSWNVMWGK